MKNVGKILAALLALAVLLSFSSVIAFADEAEDSAVSTDAVSDESKGEESSEETSKNEASAETKADDESKKDTTTSTSTSTTTKKDDDHFLLYTGLITLGIIVVIAICVVVWILKDKERALKTWRSFKSEFKKIVWAEKHETLKKTIIVVVALVVFGAVIGLLDYLFSLAVVSLGKLI